MGDKQEKEEFLNSRSTYDLDLNSSYEMIKQLRYTHSCILLLFSHSVMSNSLQLHGLEPARPSFLGISQARILV